MSEKKEKKQTQLTAGDSIYTFIRKKIIELQIKPGEFINVNELSEYLNVSRSPIRDALIQLEKEGLVTSAPKKGTIISKINVQRVKDERFMRACIEEKIAGEFIKVYTEKHIIQLKNLIELQKKAAKASDLREFLRLDDEFHAVFYEAADRIFCLEAIKNMSGHYYRIRLLSLSDPDIAKQTLDQHEEILNLILAKDYESISKLLFSHICEKGDEVNRLMARYPDLFTGIIEVPKEKGNIWELDFLKL